jgi:hypothetical protein
VRAWDGRMAAKTFAIPVVVAVGTAAAQMCIESMFQARIW